MDLKYIMRWISVKTLIINGSPRKNGDTMTLVNEMIKYLEGEVKIINTYYDNISPCVDCRYCWNNNRCAIDDEMQEVYKFINEADNIVLASPIYFSELTGQLLSFASRLQLFYASKYIRKDKEFKLKNKRGVLVLAGGGGDTKGIECAGKTAEIIFKQMNAELIGTISTLHTDHVSAKDDIEAMNKAKEFALKLNELH